jgi:hypothetical protein
MPEAIQLKADPLHRMFEKHEHQQLIKFRAKLIAAGVPEGDDISQFALHYIAFRKLKIPQVRELIVTCVEDFLNMVNVDAKIIPQLKKHPITYKDIKFNVGFGDIEGNFQEPPCIAYAYLDDGIIYYCYEDFYFKNFIEEENVEEPYETAKEILRSKDTLPEKASSD